MLQIKIRLLKQIWKKLLSCIVSYFLMAAAWFLQLVH